LCNRLSDAHRGNIPYAAANTVSLDPLSFNPHQSDATQIAVPSARQGRRPRHEQKVTQFLLRRGNPEESAMFAGSRQFLAPDEAGAPPLSALLHYPCAQPSAPTRFGPYELDVSVDAPLAPGRFPLVLISHGSGGSPLLYRTLSEALARSGYIVALLKHPGNSLGDDDLANTVENLRNRPRQLLRLLDALPADAALGAAIADEPVTAIGHSMGGYTVLCLAGAEPWTRAREPIEVPHDSRFGALVLMAPACGFFLAPHALQAVTAPILALTAEHDELTPDVQIRAALAGLPDRSRVTIQTVPNAGHFSFLSPFPRAMHSPQFAPAQDPSGFDRERFHQRLPVTVLQWIRERRGEQRVRAAGVAGL
jgi:predicted dienelactone hydrolase